ncbi:hypothetical protein BOTBODRAFT_259165 [Botryobasidium botryosum FD-172 SS1]|uniref:Uncharacterized protein n=1 Tax=Botryobasidium botryosum (strain FD-172 SS1) TaxID=930990 RepID=A0A067MNJ9_BOTB1|nr:hypothetical protein BOTBODRAFT_259165 [Botryobasidium botryosum FD-172 SS1]
MLLEPSPISAERESADICLPVLVCILCICTLHALLSHMKRTSYHIRILSVKTYGKGDDAESGRVAWHHIISASKEQRGRAGGAATARE